MNRRKFITKGALGVGATALVGVGTQDEAAAQRVAKWDRSADVVIAGAGASGLCAAIMARDQGASVIVVEQNHDIGGHAMVSGGRVPLGGGTRLQKKFGIIDSADQVYLDHENRPPAMTGSPAQTTNVSDTLRLTATATDDGHPMPVPDPTGHLQQGVRLRWIVYRGAGKVRFEPDIMNQRVYGKPATLETKVRFAVPGAYRLRAIASDGQTFSTYDVDVTVK